MRCGVLHNGTYKTKKLQYDRIVLFPPQVTIMADNCIMDAGAGTKMFTLNLVLFCDRLIGAAKKWLEDPSTNIQKVQSNMDDLVRFRPDGLPPYVTGQPVVA